MGGGSSSDASPPNGSQRPLDGGEIQGILTQTVLSSPVIKWILPARLRSKSHNDVIFVGEKNVQIKEAVQAGYLADVAQKTDFRGPILAAKVLNVTTQLPLESQIQSEAVYDGPSQILVLSVDMQELQFLYCSPSNHNEFITFRRPFPQGPSLGVRFGKHIAVDPKLVFVPYFLELSADYDVDLVQSQLVHRGIASGFCDFVLLMKLKYR